MLKTLPNSFENDSSPPSTHKRMPYHSLPESTHDTGRYMSIIVRRQLSQSEISNLNKQKSMIN
jgi:hypothetical protein